MCVAVPCTVVGKDTSGNRPIAQSVSVPRENSQVALAAWVTGDPVDQTIASVRRETIRRYYACVVVYLTLSLSGTLHVRCRAGVHKQAQRDARKS